MGSTSSHKKRMEKQASLGAASGPFGVNDTDAEQPSALVIANPDSFLGHSQTSFHFADGAQIKSQLDEFGNVKLYDSSKNGLARNKTSNLENDGTTVDERSKKDEDKKEGEDDEEEESDEEESSEEESSEEESSEFVSENGENKPEQ